MICNVVLTLNEAFAFTALLESFTNYSWQVLYLNIQQRASLESYGRTASLHGVLVSECLEHPQCI